MTTSVPVLDLILLAIVAVSVLVGALRGLLREAMSLIVWIAAIWVSSRYASWLAPQLAGYIGNEFVRLWAAHLLLAVVVLTAGGLITWLLNMALHGMGFGGTNRVVGMLFGFARGVLLAAIAVIVLGVAGFDDEPWWRQSKLLPYAAPVAEVLREAAKKRLGGPSSPPDARMLPVGGGPG
jgi:membrane protein required for colicin V production